MQRVAFCGLLLTGLLLAVPGWAEQAADADAAAPASQAGDTGHIPEPPATPKRSKKEIKEAERAALRAEVDALLQRDPEKADYVDEERCISTRRVRRVQVLDDQHVTFQTGRDEYYLVQFERRCPGLMRNKPVMYEKRSQRLCTHDLLRAVSEYAPFGELQTGVPCPIPGFQSITREQMVTLRDMLHPRRKASAAKLGQ